MKRLEVKRANGFPWAAFVALSFGMIVFGLAESYGPLTAISEVIPKNLFWLGLSIPYIFGGIGALFAGYIADRLGRKVSFMLSSGLVLVGMLLYLPLWFNTIHGASRIAISIISMALVGMSAIGLETPVLAMISESVGSKHRSKLLVITQNFGNLGVALAFVPLLIFGLNSARAYATNYEVAMLLMYFAPIIGLIIAWLKASETIPWRAVKTSRNVEEAWKTIDADSQPVKPTGGMALRFATLIILGIVQDIAFVYILYGIPGAYFTSISGLIALTGGFIMAAVGIIAGLLITPKLGRKEYTITSFGLLAGLWGALWAVASRTATNNLILFMFSLVMIPLELTWAARALLEPELFPTRNRGLYISIVRASVWISTGVITGFLAMTSPSFLMGAASMMAVALIGVFGALMWYFKGFETGNKSLSGLDIRIANPPIIATNDPKDV
ncbi:MAG: sugar porter family MFS transporter [Caldisphaeraceae archaeon]|nr:sugar porter family MFS transporter [Caldisphaeraceae archaeon]